MDATTLESDLYLLWLTPFGVITVPLTDEDLAALEKANRLHEEESRETAEV